MHQRDGLHRDPRLVEELQFLATLGAILPAHASGMGGNRLAFLDRGGWNRESLAQMQLVRIRFGGEAFALLTKVLAAEPLDLVFQRSDPLGLRTRAASLFS